MIENNDGNNDSLENKDASECSQDVMSTQPTLSILYLNFFQMKTTELLKQQSYEIAKKGL